jgi:branched-chain amino acid transport system ATP-binding protein
MSDAVPLLELAGVAAGYGDVPIVHDIALRVAERSITTLIGPNGAGKSTLLRTIYGLTRLFSGRIVFAGSDVARTTPSERLRLGIGLVPQGRCNFSHLSVADNLELGTWTLPKPARSAARTRVLEQFPVLRTRLGVLAGNLSGGEQQILEMAMVLEAGPRLLLLDEPSLGLSPRNQESVFQTVLAIRDAGITVVVVEQNTQRALGISDTAVVLELGRKILEGPARDVMNDPRVGVAYLGQEHAKADADGQ